MSPSDVSNRTDIAVKCRHKRSFKKQLTTSQVMESNYNTYIIISVEKWANYKVKSEPIYDIYPYLSKMPLRNWKASFNR